MLYMGAPLAAATLFSNEAAFENATQSLTVIDFTTDAADQALANGVVIDDEYTSLGLTFASSPGFPITNFRNSDLPTNGQGNYSGGNFIQLVPSTQGGGTLSLSFSNQTRSFAIWLGDLEDVAGTSTLTAALADGSQETIDLNPVAGDGPFQFVFFGATFDKNISTITLSVSPSDYVIFDDVAFGSVAPVPLPAAGWMLLASVGGIAAMKRRKKA